MNIHSQSIGFVMGSMLFLSACGGGGSAPTDSTNIENCTTNTYTSLKKDDKITGLEANTEVRITHSEDGTKTICILEGKAKIN